jgi:hypothetical protein
MHFQSVFAKNCFCFTSLPAKVKRNHLKLFALIKVKLTVTRNYTGCHGNNYHLNHLPMGLQYRQVRYFCQLF